MDIDARILRLVRQGPGAVSLVPLCLLLFPTLSLAEMHPLLTGFVAYRCQLLVGSGHLHRVGQDLFLPARRPRKVYLA